MKLNEGLTEEQFKELILDMLEDNSEYAKEQYKFLPIDDLSKDSSIEKKYLRLQDFIRNKTRIAPKMWANVDEKLKEVINEVFSQIVEKKLCPAGKAYAERRKKPKSEGGGGEKHSAYLMGRAVKVCNRKKK